MREKYDKNIKKYFLLSIIVGLLIISTQFFQFLAVANILFILIFSLTSIGATIYFVQREYNKQLLIVPIYFMGLSITYYSLSHICQLFNINVPEFGLKMFGIIFSMSMITYSTFILVKYRK